MCDLAHPQQERWAGLDEEEKTSEDLSPGQAWGQEEGTELLKNAEKLPGGVRISGEA